MNVGAIVVMALAGAAQGDREPGFNTFIGSCWKAQFTATMADTHCFERVIGGSHIRDTHRVVDQGRTIYEGETTYSVDGDKMAFTYINSMGGVGQGVVTQVEYGFRFKGSMRASPDKQRQPIDSEWRVLDDDHYDVRSLVPSASTGANSVLHFIRQK